MFMCDIIQPVIKHFLLYLRVSYYNISISIFLKQFKWGKLIMSLYEKQMQPLKTSKVNDFPKFYINSTQNLFLHCYTKWYNVDYQ